MENKAVGSNVKTKNRVVGQVETTVSRQAAPRYGHMAHTYTEGPHDTARYGTLADCTRIVDLELSGFQSAKTFVPDYSMPPALQGPTVSALPHRIGLTGALCTQTTWRVRGRVAAKLQDQPYEHHSYLRYQEFKIFVNYIKYYSFCKVPFFYNTCLAPSALRSRNAASAQKY